MQTQQPQQPQADDDRKDSNAAAKALAMAGAGMAFAQCMQLRREANKTQDETMKVLLKKMAADQCAQAMKDMADAMKNDNNAKELAKQDMPQMQQQQPQQTQQPEDPTEDPAPSPVISTENTPTPSQSPVPVPTSTVENNTPRENTGLSTVSQEVAGGAALDPISSNVKVIDTPKPENGSTSGQSSAAYNSPLSSASRGLASNEEKKNSKDSEKGSSRNAKAEKGSEASGASSDDSGSKSKGNGEDSASSLLAQLMGGGTNAELMGGGGNVTQIVQPNEGGPGEKKMNIFEFAASQYRDLAYKNSKVRPRFNAKPTSS